MQARNQLGEAGRVDPVSLSRIASQTAKTASPSNCFFSPLAWFVGAGIIRPEANAPHWVQRTDSSQKFVASAQKVIFHGWILREFGVGARYRGVLLLPVPNGGVEVAHALIDALCVLGSGDDIMSSSARWPSYAAPRKNMTRRPPQTTKGIKVKNRIGAARTTPICLWIIREKGPKLSWIFGPAMLPSGNTRPRHFGPVVSPCGNTRPRENANSNPRFLVSSPLCLLAAKRKGPLELRPKNGQNRRHQPVGSLVGH